MVAVLDAFDASGDDDYQVTLDEGDTAAFTAALDSYSPDMETDGVGRVDRVTAGNIRPGSSTYGALWERDELEAAIYALRAYALNGESDSDTADKDVDRAWSLLSYIAETLGVEFV
jgi:hypothetical protein